MSKNAKSQISRRSGTAYAMMMTRHGGFMHDRREVRGGATNKQKTYLEELDDDDDDLNLDAATEVLNNFLEMKKS